MGDEPPERATPPDRPLTEAEAIAAEIGALMAGPIKQRPTVIILGDDVMTGFSWPS